MGPHPVIPDHTLGQGAGVLVAVLAIMLVLTNLNIHIVKSTQTCDEQTIMELFKENFAVLIGAKQKMAQPY